MADTTTLATAPRRVLVIDDQETSRYILRRILVRAGYEVDEAATGTDGLHRALSSPDLVIADVNLPDMLGYEVSRRLKSNPRTAGIPVVQMSASFTSDESRVQALDGGADCYLTQPIEPAVLLAQVNALLRMRRAEAQSAVSAAQWKTTFDALSDGVALTDAAGEVIRANGALLHLLEFTASAVEGRPLADVLAARFPTPFAELLAATHDGHTTDLCWDSRWFRLRLDRIVSGPETHDGLILIVADITQQRRLEETLKLSERLAATGRLAHVIAHEINNPLEAMSNLIYLAQHEADVPETACAYLDQAAAELLRISQITKQVLAYHRGSDTPVLTRASDILSSVLALFRTSIEQRGLTLRLDAACDEELMLHPGEIRQVLTNILSNALDASRPGGTLRVRCRLSCDSPSNRMGVRFIFSDDGGGIPDEVYPRIFEAFYTTKHARGSGVGLWLSGEVVGKHMGRIRVRTRTTGAYRGTLFDVFLPLPSQGAGARR